MEAPTALTLSSWDNVSLPLVQPVTGWWESGHAMVSGTVLMKPDHGFSRHPHEDILGRERAQEWGRKDREKSCCLGQKRPLLTTMAVLRSVV